MKSHSKVLIGNDRKTKIIEIISGVDFMSFEFLYFLGVYTNLGDSSILEWVKAVMSERQKLEKYLAPKNAVAADKICPIIPGKTWYMTYTVLSNSYS